MLAARGQFDRAQFSSAIAIIEAEQTPICGEVHPQCAVRRRRVHKQRAALVQFKDCHGAVFEADTKKAPIATGNAIEHQMIRTEPRGSRVHAEQLAMIGQRMKPETPNVIADQVGIALRDKRAERGARIGWRNWDVRFQVRQCQRGDGLVSQFGRSTNRGSLLDRVERRRAPPHATAQAGGASLSEIGMPKLVTRGLLSLLSASLISCRTQPREHRGQR